MNLARNYEPLTAFVLTWTAKATVVLVIAWVVSFASRRSSAALRHRIWTIAIIGSLALPIAALVIPAWHLTAAPPGVPLAVSQTAVVTNTAVLPPAPAQQIQNVDIGALIGTAFFIWALGAAFVALRIIVGMARLWRISACSKRAHENAYAALDELRASFGIRRKVRLLESASAAMMPMTWGIFRPTVVLPSGADEWVDERRRIVLSHELSHVRRGDWPLQICAEMLRACFWFHPLAWIAANRLRQESERACDDAVLNSGIGAPEYASQLLALAQTLTTPRWRFSLALAIARRSNLERRFAAMLDSSLSRGPISLKVSSIGIAVGACLLLPLAALTLSAEAPPVQTTAGNLASMAAAAVLPYDRTGTASSALLRTENQATTRPRTPGRLSVAQPKRPVVSDARDTSDAQSVATAAPSKPGPVGSISGTVGDPGGARVPRASVALTDVATGQQEQVTAGEVGEFNFSNVIPDVYRLSIKQPGFKDYSQEVQVFPGAQMNLQEILLSIGDISQVITVSTSRGGTAVMPEGIFNSARIETCPATPQQATQPAYKNPVQPGPAPTRIRVGGNVEQARLVQQTMPIYPEPARVAGIQGTVVLNGIIGKDGTLLSTCVVSGPQILVQSALDAVSQWRYSPVLLNGEPVEALTQIGVVFTLKN